MEFLLYLSPIGSEIIQKVMSQRYLPLENAPICRNHDLSGIIKDKGFIICTDNIKNADISLEFYVNETVYHEATHVAQFCKGGVLGIKGISLPSNKRQDVLNSLKASNGHNKTIEMESYYLEDKPEMVLSFLKKYCH